MRLPLRRLLSGSWLLGSTSRCSRPWCRSGLALLVALAALALGAKLAVLLAVLALSVLLAVFGAILLLTIRPARALARSEIGRRRLVVAADDHLGAIGQIGKARHDDLVGRRQAAGDHGVMLVLLRDGHRLGRHHIILADDIAERADRSALHGRGRHHQCLGQGL